MKNIGRLGLGVSFLVGTGAAIATGCSSGSSGAVVVSDPYYNAVAYDYYDPYWSSSFYYGGGWYYLDHTENAAALTACVPTKTVVATAMECNNTYDSNVNLQWSCANVGTEGAAITGSAQVATILTPDTCPATSLAGSKNATLSRTRTVGRDSITTNGSVMATWTTSPGIAPPVIQLTRNVSRQVFRDSSLQLDQAISGNHTVNLTYDDVHTPTQWTSSGTSTIEFKKDGFTVTTVDNALNFQNGCCYPLSGTTQFTITGNRTGSGTLTFGPSCGNFTNDGGKAFTLPSCTP
jgi:hypothetical protein